MLEYFEENYPWNLAVVTALSMGAVASDVDAACRPLRALRGADTAAASRAWADAWTALGDRLRRQAAADERDRHPISAGEKRLRGALYYLIAERVLRSSDPRKLELYRLGIEMFRRGVALRGARAELVDVPYRGGSLPCVFLRAAERGPCVIHFNGFDWIKEFTYLGLAEAYRRRGISSLFCDQPGSGGALRLSGLPAEVESEHAAGACVDYLQTRSDVDPRRIGIQGLSLGGYYAPRAAAFEKRLACCAVSGAFWDAMEVVQKRAAEGARYAGSVPDIDDQLKWVVGTDSMDDVRRWLARVTLRDVAERITCPLLVVHGGMDRQIPVDHAQKTYDAARNSPNRRVVVLGPDDGGVEHCSIDNQPLVVEICADWIADVLGAEPIR